jgi:hypothetical protein
MMDDKMPEGDTDLLAGLRAQVSASLKGFTAERPPSLPGALTFSYRPETARFPVPELVLYLFRDIMGWTYFGPWEKVRWTVIGAVDGQPIAFELRKFGFTISRPPDRPDLDQRIEGQLIDALKRVERHLAPVARAQVANGEVLVINRFYEFDERYRFLRDLADRAYLAGSDPPQTSVDETSNEPVQDQLNRITSGWNSRTTSRRHGFFLSSAMIDAWFSCLEHRLALLRAFTGRPIAEGELMTFLTAKWDEKLKAVLSKPLPREAGLLLGRLRVVKERIRNPLAHGGVENDLGSLFFHLPNIGSVPANFSGHGKSARFSILPVGPRDHDEICELFDAVDQLLSTGELSAPNQILLGGVDPAFDASSLEGYADAIAGDTDHVEAFVDAWSNGWELHVNMDY